MRNPAASSIVDFHCHHVPAGFEVTAGSHAPASLRARWDVKLADEGLLLTDVRDGHLAARVVNIPAGV